MRPMNIGDIPRCDGLVGDEVNSLIIQQNLTLPYITDRSEVKDEGVVKRKCVVFGRTSGLRNVRWIWRFY